MYQKVQKNSYQNNLEHIIVNAHFLHNQNGVNQHRIPQNMQKHALLDSDQNIDTGHQR